MNIQESTSKQGQSQNTNRRFLPRLRAPFQANFDNSNKSLQGLDISFQGMLCRGQLGNSASIPDFVSLDLGTEAEPIVAKVSSIEMCEHRGNPATRVSFLKPSYALRLKIAQWMGRAQSKHQRVLS
jgi:hypothetical protein